MTNLLNKTPTTLFLSSLVNKLTRDPNLKKKCMYVCVGGGGRGSMGGEGASSTESQFTVGGIVCMPNVRKPAEAVLQIFCSQACSDTEAYV